VTLPPSVMPPPEVVNLTALPITASNDVAPAEAKVTAPVEVSGEVTATEPVLLSLKLISSGVVVDETLSVFNLSGAAAVPRVPVKVFNCTAPAPVVVIVAAPVMLPATAVKLTAVVLVLLPRVAPLSVMLPLRASMLIVLAAVIVGVTVTPVDEVRVNDPVVVAVETVSGAMPVPGKPRLLRLTSEPAELAESVLVEISKGVSAEPIVPLPPVFNVRVLA